MEYIYLSPYESTIVMFGEEAPDAESQPGWREARELEIRWSVSLMETGISSAFSPLMEGTALPNITGPPLRPEFSGVIRYEGSFDWDGATEGLALDLGEVAQVALNGEELGLRICKPYRYGLDGVLKSGANHLVAEVANTLVHRAPDRFSAFVRIPPSGLIGPVRLMKAGL